METGKLLCVIGSEALKNISLITVYNNINLLQQMVESASMQENVTIDYVLIDNRTNQFASAAAALNYGAKKAKGEVLVFLHQDIEFLEKSALSDIYRFGVTNQNTIFGAAGVKSKLVDTGEFFSSMYAGEDKVQYKCCTAPANCYTLDECLIACHKDVMKRIKFDEETCNGWHLYGADFCLQAGLIPEYSVMVIPMDYVWHKSNGNADKYYIKTQDLLAKKYRGKYKIINTTNGFQYTNPVKRLFVSTYRRLRYRAWI